ncbi:GIY-YIG nuclease family protein [Bradyrhizobium jicamae]|uniref:GIY-YIG nuclease family protein n=1 Tax=Bradyrhizobium jicamae TaxID=280332 RepID=A0ABS5FU99_9BRAD|nr:GIY-YIG nuclease family protein [Bradyrhizobium jicamae]MBR0800419.1 GIY-YIG nuclease family protein [Bradyrhizobium jicamae]
MSDLFSKSLNAAAAAQAIFSSGKLFYVYVLLRSNGEPFYVGKGSGNRIFDHEPEARNTTLRTHKLNVIRAIMAGGDQICYALPHFCDDEAEAHEVEVKLISSIGRHDLRKGPLTNQTEGGKGTAGLSSEIMARKAANLGGPSTDPQRRLANELFHSISGQQDSVPIKPFGTRRLEPTVPHPMPRQPKERMARAIAVACLATDQLLSVGVRIPRSFLIDGKPYVLENGVGKDMLKAGMISVHSNGRPENEEFTLTELGFESTVHLISRSRLEDLGVLEPSVQS